MKNLSRLALIIFILILLPAAAYFVMESSGATTDNSTNNKVVYDLPYPGMLSDNPVYFVKIIRDRITEFLTRDNLKKAQLYLLYSDKRVAMSLSLAKKGKNNQAISAYSKAEKYFLKIPPLLEAAKKQGESPPSSFIEILKLSNAKHKELLNQLLKTLPAGVNTSLSEVAAINDQIRLDLERL
jgi:hypothetical protein